MVSDLMGRELVNLLDDISSRGIIPGIATHDPVLILNYSIENSLNVRAFLIPFNASGDLMGNKKKLENLVNNTENYYFIGMKTLAAGTIKPSRAFKYISKHNICAVTLGMVSTKQAKESTLLALKSLERK